MGTSRRRPTAIDLFAGAGGLSLGFEQAGFNVLCAAEYDPIHAATHLFNFPNTEVVCADLAYVDRKELIAAAHEGWKRHGYAGTWDESLDVLIGGPPCQGFSTGGKRSTEDARNQLVFRFVELVAELQPRYFVMENVQGLASFVSDARGTKLLPRLVKRLADAGYCVREPMILNACAFGLPQDRRRLFLVGTRAGLAIPALPSPSTRGRPRRPGGHLPTGANSEGPLCPSVWDAIGDLPDPDAFSELLETDVACLSTGALESLNSNASNYARRLRGIDEDPADLSRERTWNASLLTSSCRTSHQPNVKARFAATQEGSPEPISRFLRLYRHGVSCTLRAGSHYDRGAFNAPRPIHPTQSRVITVREAARLHGYPDWFRFHWTKWHGFRQVGNSVPPLVARAVAQTVITALGVAPSRTYKPVTLGDQKLLRMENLRAAEHFNANRDHMPRNSLRDRSGTLAEAA